MGFEPTDPFRGQHISSVLLSTTQPLFQNFIIRLILLVYLISNGRNCKHCPICYNAVMYIGDSNQKNIDEDKLLRIDKLMREPEDIEDEDRMLSEPEDIMISEHSMDVLAHWRAPEYEIYARDKKWYLYITLALAAIVGYAICSNGVIMAITFILIGVVGYIHLNKDPRILDFIITPEGVLAGRELYEFENLLSFWIFYEPDGKKAISLRTKSRLVPYVHIPIHEENPAELREILVQYIPEEKQEEGIVEIAERVLKI